MRENADRSRKDLSRRSFVRGTAFSLLGVVALGAVPLTGALAGCSGETESADGSTDAGGDTVRKIIIGTTANSAKTSFVDDDGNITGYDVELLQEVDSRLPEYELEFVQMDFSSLFSALETNKVDLITGNFRRSEEREEKYLYTTVPYLYYPYRIIVLEENDSINSLDDLKGKKVGLSPGALQTTIVEKWNAANGNEIEIVYATGSTYIEDLKAGRIDATVLGEFLADLYNETSDAGLKVVGPVLREDDGVASDSNAYFITRQDEAEFRDAVDGALQAIKDEGLLSELSIKWHGKDNTPKDE